MAPGARMTRKFVKRSLFLKIGSIHNFDFLTFFLKKSNFSKTPTLQSVVAVHLRALIWRETPSFTAATKQNVLQDSRPLSEHQNNKALHLCKTLPTKWAENALDGDKNQQKPLKLKR